MKDLFCEIIAGNVPSTCPYEDEYVKCIMDVNPFSPGHTLIIPKKHFTTMLDIDDEYVLKIQESAKMIVKKMETNFPGLTGLKVAVNYGDEQKIKHYHMHILPLYEEGTTALSQEEYAELLKK